jgi:4-amino-4-deoxy-L-arabinose transferase-like glycosyltransferase
MVKTKTANAVTEGGAVPELGEPGRPSLARALTPRILLDSSPAEWLWRIGEERRHLILLAGLAAVVFLPYAGAVGFWDPWEAEYSEVARSMLVREDFVHPYYREAYFFSKPVLSLWLIALGLLGAGANDPLRGTAIHTEWWVRSIFALVAVAGVLFTYLAAGRTISRRVGIWAAVILCTSPMYFLLARQAMVDMPLVATLTIAVGCLLVAVFEKEHVQDGWLYGFYAAMGLAVLAKGFIGIALPGAAMLLYLMLTGDWWLLARLRLFTGGLLTALVAGPWLGTMISFRGVDDESKTFFQRFIIHDHFKRLGVDPTSGNLIGGVHTTTPNTTFVYYLEQLGFGLFPWVLGLPGALSLLFRPRAGSGIETRRRRAKLFVACWAFATFAFFAFTATKFHHYIFPVVPPLAILLAVFVVEVLDEGLQPHALALLGGLVLFGLIAQNLAMEPKHLVNLFVYQYERPYPSREVNPRAVFVGLFLLLPAIALMGIPALRGWALRGWLLVSGLFSNPQRARLAALRGQPAAEEPADRLYVVGAATTVAVLFAIAVSAWHWRKLTPHWTQRDLFWSYHQNSAPDEPIAAYGMNWHGETFYSRNTVRQMKEAGEIRRFVEPAGREWILVEHAKLAGLKSTLGSSYKVKVVDKSSNKFALVAVE